MLIILLTTCTIILLLTNIVSIILIFTCKCKHNGKISDKGSEVCVNNNNYLDVEQQLNHTLPQLTTLRAHVDIVTNFQNQIDSEIHSYFVPKIEECLRLIEDRDFLQLSVKWNTIQTLFNIDHISEYVQEVWLQYIDERTGTSNSLIHTNKNSNRDKNISPRQFRTLPAKISQIRAELDNDKDYVNELLSDIKTESNSDEESEQSDSISHTPSKGTMKIVNDSESATSLKATSIVLETVSEEPPTTNRHLPMVKKQFSHNVNRLATKSRFF